MYPLRQSPSGPDATAELRGKVVPLRRRAELGARELRVLGLISEGLTHAEAAREISAAENDFVSEQTVKSIECRAIARLGARSPAHAVAIALRLGLIS
jgi:DNA-binding NarL/FixJ family response regulator